MQLTGRILLQNSLFMSSNMTTNIDCTRKSGNVRREIFNIYGQRRRIAAKALRPDIECVYLFKHFFFKRCIACIRIG